MDYIATVSDALLDFKSFDVYDLNSLSETTADETVSDELTYLHQIRDIDLVTMIVLSLLFGVVFFKGFIRGM